MASESSSPTALEATRAVGVEPAFVRAANLSDIERLDELPPLRATPSIARALEQLLDPVGQGTDRAWTLVGPYGAGKSTLGLFLAGLLGKNRESAWIRSAVAELGNATPALRARLEEVNRSKPLIPVLVQGGARRLWGELAERLLEASDSHGSVLFGRAQRRSLKESGSRPSSPAEIRRILQGAARSASAGGYGGIIILADEFGRFLDQSANRYARENLGVAQEMAELCSRSRRSQLRLVVLLHQNLDDYGAGAGAHERSEWSKIQGRFRQVPLLSEPENLYEMMASCIRLEPEVVRGAKDAVGREWEVVKDIGPFTRSRSGWKERLVRLLPLHPLSVYCLPRLAAQLGQNERTIFSFLLSDEPHSLRAFLERGRKARGAELLGLDWLCEYFLLSQVNSFVPARVRQRLTEVTFALEQVVQSDDLAAEIVKVIGIIDIANSPELRPSAGVIAAALSIHGEEDWAALRVQLKLLSNQRVITERRYAGEFHLSSGSDFDLTEAIAEAVGGRGSSSLEAADVLNEELGMPAVTARRHAFEMGAVRVAARQFVGAEGLGLSATSDNGWRAINDRPDLTIEYVVCSSQEELKRAEGHVGRGRIRPDRVYALPREPLGISELVAQARAVRDVVARPDVQEDRIAMREAELYQENLKSLLKGQLQSAFDPCGDGRWFWRGREVVISTERDLQALVSRVCDGVFAKSPQIICELVNRRQLSTSSVVAVKMIILGLLENEETAHVGFEGNGPEMTVFHAVFERTGWHGERESGYRLGHPTGRYRLRPAWEAIQAFFESTSERRRDLSQLWDELARPPFGIRAGLAPLLIWGAMIEGRAEICLYERGTYVPTWSPELYDRFVRSPEEFEVRCVPQSPLDDVLPSLVEVLEPARTTNGDRALRINDFLQSLFSWYRALPDYTKRTGDLSRAAREFRRVLSTAADPIELVLSELPEALGVNPLGAGESDALTAGYRRRFKNVVKEIARAYPALLARLVKRMGAVLGSRGDALAVHAELMRLSEATTDDLTDVAARAFVVRGSQPPDEADAWVESLAAVLVGEPPRFWTDQSVGEFEERVAVTVGSLRQTERAQVMRAQAGLRPGGTATWVTLTGSDGAAIDEVVATRAMSAGVEAALARAEDAVRELVADLGRNERRGLLVELMRRLWED